MQRFRSTWFVCTHYDMTCAFRQYRNSGARGISVLFSSGDGGVGDNDPDPATQRCFTNDGKNETKFIPSFPAAYAHFIPSDFRSLQLYLDVLCRKVHLFELVSRSNVLL